MSKLSIGKLAIDAGNRTPLEAERLARRAAELLGQGLAEGGALRPRPEVIVNVTAPPGLSEERLAQWIAREVYRKLL